MRKVVIGGLEKSIISLCNHFSSRGYPVTLLICFPSSIDPYKTYSLHRDVRIVYLTSRRSPLLFCIPPVFAFYWKTLHSLSPSQSIYYISFGTKENIVNLLAVFFLELFVHSLHLSPLSFP